MPRTHLAALAATLVVLLGVAAPAASANSGFKDQDFTGYSSSVSPGPSGTKPESKLWFNAGSWWAVMYDQASDDFHIFKLDLATQEWSDTGVAVDDRDTTLADALWDGSHLYVASHVMKEDSTGTAGNPSRLYRYSYAGGTYSLDAGFPVTINDTSSETLVIDRDSTGQLWATWTGKNVSGQTVVWVASTACAPACDDKVWNAPTQLSAIALKADDISSLVAFGGSKIGVMWSDQTDATMWFAVHEDSAADGTWGAPEVAISGTKTADDHMNLKADSSGRVFAATKTALSGTAVIQLLVRTAAGTWVKHPFGNVGGSASSLTRPIVVLDPANAHVFMTAPDSGGSILEKTLPLSQADTDGALPGASVERIKDDLALKMNNATSTKQIVSAATGLVVLATNKKTDVTPQIRNYWHSYDSLGAADVTPPALASAGIAGAKATLTYGEPLDAASTPAPSAYAVKVNGADATVNTVTVSGSVVRLSLLAPVLAGDAVTVGYTPGAAPVQDLAGNDAAALVNQALTNTTPAGTAFDLVPTGDVSKSLVTTNSGGSTNLFAAIDDGIATPDDETSYVHNNATAAGGQDGSLVLNLTDMPSNFASMSSLKIDVRARMIARVDDSTTLYAQILKADGTPLSNEVPVATNPGPTNWATISNITFTGLVAATKSDWDGATLKLRWDWVQAGAGPDNGNRLRVTATELHATYAGGTGDVTPPLLSTAAVDGETLTLTYNEALDAVSAPAAGAFSAKVNGVLRSVNAVQVSGSTVTLTLASAVGAGDTVTVSYAVPGANPVQDVAGNDAAPLTDRAVTNSTGGGATTATLVPNGDGSHDVAIRTQSGFTTNLYQAIDERVTAPDDSATYIRNDSYMSGSRQYYGQLTNMPTGFTSMTALKLSARVRTTGRVDDSIALYAQLVRANGTPLTAEARIGSANPGASGWTTFSNLSLTGLVAGTKADWDGALLRLRWQNTVSRFADAIQLQLTAVELQATYAAGGGGGDTTPPAFQSGSVNGSTLTMTYGEALDAASKPAASAFAVSVNGVARGVSAVGISGSTVSLTLASAVTAGQTVRVAYTKPASSPLQDVAGNDAVSLPSTTVTNSTPGGGGGDTTPPVFQGASVSSSTLTMIYSENLDPGSKPSAIAFTVRVSGVNRSVYVVTISGSRVILTLAGSVSVGQVVSVSYTAPATSPLQDLAGNDAESIANRFVSNTGR